PSGRRLRDHYSRRRPRRRRPGHVDPGEARPRLRPSAARGWRRRAGRGSLSPPLPLVVAPAVREGAPGSEALRQLGPVAHGLGAEVGRHLQQGGPHDLVGASADLAPHPRRAAVGHKFIGQRRDDGALDSTRRPDHPRPPEGPVTYGIVTWVWWGVVGAGAVGGGTTTGSAA